MAARRLPNYGGECLGVQYYLPGLGAPLPGCWGTATETIIIDESMARVYHTELTEHQFAALKRIHACLDKGFRWDKNDLNIIGGIKLGSKIRDKRKKLSDHADAAPKTLWD